MKPVCLYCSKPLGWVCNTEYITDETKPPRACGRTRSVYTAEGRDTVKCRSTKFLNAADTKFLNAADGWRCADDDCRAVHAGRRKIVKQTRRYKDVGPNGDGLFCSKTHGWKFGILAARAGYRRKTSQSS